MTKAKKPCRKCGLTLGHMGKCLKKPAPLNSRNRSWMVLLESLEEAIRIAKGCLFTPSKEEGRVCHCAEHMRNKAEAVLVRLRESQDKGLQP